MPETIYSKAGADAATAAAVAALGLGTAATADAADYATAVQGAKADGITRANRAIVATSRNAEALRPIISVIDDDGHYDVITRLAPVMTARNIPLGVAVIGNASTIVTNPERRAQLKALQDDHGFEIVSHTYTHYGVHAMTEADYIADSDTMAELMAGYGFKVQNIVYPGGSEGTNKHVTARYHLAGFGTAADLNNADTIDNYQIKRIGLGSMMAAPYQTLAEFQALIDTAKAQKRWLVLMTHINATDAAGLQLIADVLDYAIAQGVAIVAPRDGVAEFGNIVQSGRRDSAGQFYIRPEGRVYSSRYQLVDWLPAARLEADAPGLLARKWVQFEVPPANPWSVGYGIVTERQHLTGWQVQRLETLTGETFQRRYNGSTWSAWSRTLQGRMQANFTISARTIPAHGQDEYTFNDAAALAAFGYVATPTGALEAGIVWSVWSHGNGAGRIRLANITGADVALAARVWTVRSIGA